MRGPWVYVAKVSQPTMTVCAPAGSNTGVAVVVFPGGGYNLLAIDLEGTEVCDWLISRGTTCVFLKYRSRLYPSADAAYAAELVEKWLGTIGLISK
jgi:hypothetical protein